LKRIENHNQKDTSRPIFLFWAPHSVHTPLQIPKCFLDRYIDKVSDWRRARYLAMVNYIDTALKTIVEALEAKHMMENTLIVCTSDNGGPVYFGGMAGANNYPLRGGKTSNFQGGIRVNAWLGGGAIDVSRRGSVLKGLSTVWDWYATFANLAGVDDTVDHQAAVSGLPPIDSFNLWPWLSGKQPSSPRDTIPIGSSSCIDPSQKPTTCINKWGWGNTTTIVSGVIMQEKDTIKGEISSNTWKLLLGLQTMNGWQGPMYPNISTATDAFDFQNAFIYDCGDKGCLYHLNSDPEERDDLRTKNISMEKKAEQLLYIIRRENRTTFSPDRGPGEQYGHITEACDAAEKKWGGFWGSFLESP
jgi:arylsulfatase I/J